MAAAAAAASAGADSKGGLEAMSPIDRLHEFCRRGAKQSVQELLTSDKTLINKKGNLGNLAVHWAASTGADDVLEYLLAQGGSINAQNDVGDTPLHLAVWKDHLAAVRVLKKRKADKSMPNQDDKTAPQMARSQTMKELLPEMDESEVADSIQVVGSDDDDDEEEAAPAAAATKPRPPPPKPAGATGGVPKPPPPKPVQPASGAAAAAPPPKPVLKAPPPPPRRA